MIRFDVIGIECSDRCITYFNIHETHFHPSIDIGKVYTISKGIIKLATKNINHLKNDLEINLGSTTTIESSLQDEHSIANHNFILNPIKELSTLTNNSIVDIIGVVISINPLVTIIRKNGMETHKRTLQIRARVKLYYEVHIMGVLCNKHNL